MPNSADEKEVRDSWELVHRCDGSYRDYPEGTILVLYATGKWWDFPSWSAAAAFTRERKEQIRLVKREIECLQLAASIVKIEAWADAWQQAFNRILVREQAALTELTKDMKP